MEKVFKFLPTCFDVFVLTLQGVSDPVFICKVIAIGGGEITYSLDESTYFAIDPSTGDIHTRDNTPFDYEKLEERRFVVC